MDEAVIILSDLYFVRGQAGASGAPHRLSAADGAVRGALRGFRRIARFGTGRPIADWRGFLARWLGRADLAGAAPAALAQAAAAAPSGPARDVTLWLLQPVHLSAGLTGVHLGYRGLIHLDGPSGERLCADFNAAFGDGGYRMQSLGGALMLAAPDPAADIATTEPARCLGGVVDGTSGGAGSAQLRRLCAEIEMWLHGHPLNRERERRRLPPVSALWPWGAGVPLGDASAALDAGAVGVPAAAQFSGAGAHRSAVLGDDAAARGLARLTGAAAGECAAGAGDIIACGVARVAAVVELFQLPQAQEMAAPAEVRLPQAPLLQALEHFDRRFLLPLLDALGSGELRRLSLIANDRCFELVARDRWRLWRRGRDPLAVLA